MRLAQRLPSTCFLPAPGGACAPNVVGVTYATKFTSASKTFCQFTESPWSRPRVSSASLNLLTMRFPDQPCCSQQDAQPLRRSLMEHWSMKWGHRTPLGRDLPSWTVLTAALGVLLGCTTITDGSAVAAGEHSAQPVKWGQCQIVGGGDGGQLPPTAQCGNLAVPIDYAKPDGPFAHLALIRFPATGRKIGSLVINPGGPGGSGVDAAVGLLECTAAADPATVRPDRLRPARYRLLDAGAAVQFRRRPRRTIVPTRRSTTARPASPTSRQAEKQFVQRCVATMGTDFLANIGTAEAVKDLEALRIALGDREADLPRLLVRHLHRFGLRRGISGQGARNGPRRRSRPEC